MPLFLIFFFFTKVQHYTIRVLTFYKFKNSPLKVFLTQRRSPHTELRCLLKRTWYSWGGGRVSLSSAFSKELRALNFT